MIHIVSRIFNYTGCTKQTLALWAPHNLQGKLSQCQIFVLSLNVDREREI